MATADLRGVLSLCSSCWERGGWTERGAGLPRDMDTCQEGQGGDMGVVGGSCCGVRGRLHLPGAADPADGGS